MEDGIELVGMRGCERYRSTKARIVQSTGTSEAQGLERGVLFE